MTVIEVPANNFGVPWEAVKAGKPPIAVVYMTWVFNDFAKKVGQPPTKFEVSEALYEAYEDELAPVTYFSAKAGEGLVDWGLKFKTAEVKPKEHLKGWEVRAYV